MSESERDRFVILVWMDGHWQVGASSSDAGEVAWKAGDSGLSLFPLLLVDTLDKRVPYVNHDTLTR